MSSPSSKSGSVAIDVDALEKRYAEEREKRLRALEASRGAADPMLREEFADFDRDFHADPAFDRAPLAEEVDVLVIGGGMGGLLTAAKLRERGVKDLRIIEKGGGFGGTWYWNRYPGAACDVEAYIYLPMLEQTGYMPKERYSKAAEIRAYLDALADRYDLRASALFQTIATRLSWNEGRKRWIAETSRGDEIAARFVVSCTGVLSNPRLPKIPGIGDFVGRSFHTSRWDYGYTGGEEDGRLTGLLDKKVGVIGTGATALQVIPGIAQWAGELYVFQRTPSSVDERGNRVTDPDWFRSISAEPGWQLARQENFASILSGVPEEVDMVQDGWTEIVRYVSAPTGGDGSAADDHMATAGYRKMELARQRIDAVVKDRQTAEALKPYFHYFCKRPGFHDEYLDAFNRANVTLVDTEGRGVERITTAGAVVGGREYQLDCLIYATGFDFMMEYTRESGLAITGRDGLSLEQHWQEGPRTLYAVQTDRFPNFFFLRLAQAGNSPNYTLTVEEQSSYVVDVIATALERKLSVVEATREAVDGWVEEIVEKAAPRQQFLKTCTPGQYNFEGDAQGARYSILNELYGGGAIAYFEIMRARRSEGRLKGLKGE
jgi:cyclohexanone monooxygenase